MSNPVTIVGFTGPLGTTQVAQVADRQYNSPVSSIVTNNATTVVVGAGQKLFLQNWDDAALYVKLGVNASTSDASFILSAGSAANDGLGGSKDITDYVGTVSFAPATGTVRFVYVLFS